MNFTKSPLTPEARARDAQSKFMEEAVQKVEKYFGHMCREMGSVSRKTARLRDKYDKLAKTCLDYANEEQGSLNKHLTRFAEQISNIQDYRQAEIERLQANVIEPLSDYGAKCKNTQADLNKSFKAQKQELRQQEKVLTLQNRSPNNRHGLSLAEAELQKRTIDVARTTRMLEETVDDFEVKKVQDLKKILSEFVKIEMLFHAKALEIYSESFKELTNIDEEEHIEVFRNSLRPTTNMQERLDLAKNAANLSLHNTPPERDERRKPAATLRNRNNRRHHEEEDDDFVDEDDEDEDYDDEELGSEEESDDEFDDVSEVESSHAQRRRR